MEVSVTEFRADLKKWLDLVQSGEEIVVTERGVPVARVSPVGEAEWLEQLTREGILSRPLAPKTKRSGQKLIKAEGSVSDLIIEMRRGE
jgi:prevent-host-death family protein